METLGDNLGAKRAEKGQPKYVCKPCDFVCCKKYNWERHITTTKHIEVTESEHLVTEKGQKGQKNCCENCGKEYLSRNGLWKHKQKCNQIEKDETKQEITKDEINLVEYLMKENKEIKEMILEIVKNGINSNNNTITHNNNTTNNTHTNSHNKAFNLNFFLNETCKNAMNITDFVDSIKLQLSDLMEVGELGYVEGISKIIVKNLNNLDETIRPVHCTDKKRETMYVKDQGEWNKEDEKKTKLTKAVKKIADKNIRLLPQFREKYPEYKNSSSKTSDKYDKIVIEAMTTDEDKNEKIIKNISKVTTIT
jgi:hypothetical protein